jgi:hypothetical protein
MERQLGLRLLRRRHHANRSNRFRLGFFSYVADEAEASPFAVKLAEAGISSSLTITVSGRKP